MQQDFTLNAYDFNLPEKNIAQKPADNREQSKLLVVHRRDNSLEHRIFSDIADYLQRGDMLVVNDTRVFPARLHGRKAFGGKAEIFLLEFPLLQPGKTDNGRLCASVPVLIKSSKRPKPGSSIEINNNLSCIVDSLGEGGKAEITLYYPAGLDLATLLEESGQVPLPPYISRENGTTEEDRQRYQTVYANRPGAVAAPTAGLHFTTSLLEKLRAQGILTGSITLNVGYGTFAPVRVDDITSHDIHHEYINVSEQVVNDINEVKRKGGKIWAVGTTTVRALEFAAKTGKLKPTEGWCDLYILPGFQFNVIDHLITNFHLPKSSLLFLVSALCGRENLLDYYQEAIEKGYRFYSYGDAMVIL